MGRKSSARTRGGAEGSEPAPADATGQRNIFRAGKAVAAVAELGDGERRAVIGLAGLVPARAARAALLHRRPPRSLPRRAARVGPRLRRRRRVVQLGRGVQAHADRVAGRRRVPPVQNSAAQPAAAGGRGSRRRNCWRGLWQGYRRPARRARTRDARRRRAARGDPGQAAARRRAAAAAAAARRWGLGGVGAGWKAPLASE